METYTKVSGKMAKRMAEGSFVTIKVLFMTVSGTTIFNMAKV
jgi:hypothetical protein